MRKTTWSLLAPALLLSSSVLAQDRVKCLLTLDTGEQTIRVVMLESAKGSTQWLHKQVGAELVFLADGTTRVGISEVHECVHPEGEFRNRDSRQIARTIPQ